MYVSVVAGLWLRVYLGMTSGCKMFDFVASLSLPVFFFMLYIFETFKSQDMKSSEKLLPKTHES